MKTNYLVNLFWSVTVILIQIAWTTTAKADQRISIKDQLEAIEINTEGKSYKLDTLISLTSFGKGLYLAIFSVDTAADAYHLVPYFIDSQSFNVRQIIPFDEYEIEGVYPEIKLVFTANADSDSIPELIIQVGWHYDDVNAVGWFYRTHIYDRDSNASAGFIHKKYSERIIPNEAQANRQGEHLHAKYNTEAKIRRRLTQLGYRQYAN